MKFESIIDLGFQMTRQSYLNKNKSVFWSNIVTFLNGVEGKVNQFSKSETIAVEPLFNVTLVHHSLESVCSTSSCSNLWATTPRTETYLFTFMTHFAEFKRLGLLCNPKSTILNIHDAEISETLGLGFGLSLEYLETRVSVSDPLEWDCTCSVSISISNLKSWCRMTF